MVAALLAALSLAMTSPFRPVALDVLVQARVASLNPVAFQDWLQRRPFAAVLPIQPMLVQPLQPPQYGVDITFRRKPSSEKGGQDGGLRLAVGLDIDQEEGGEGTLLVTRISEGQYTAKQFSEKAICRALIKDLNDLPSTCGEVLSIVDLLAKPSE